ncbi:hypothetical protein [Jidongwangia harbinensis]|uniref:hypothetical protein n=1 Tax=Jidongwangia harbinensis TaxID=2878561 RepID=UPI001CD94F34|nr:hypothetical protein [Jidongwangia harbinensis]MCA2216128.1 hypothetical protein [Jidongwangia harbinensis]
MEDASAASFRPTWQQSLARGLYLGVLLSAVGVSVALLATLAGAPSLPTRCWLLLALGPSLAGAPVGLLWRRRAGTVVDAGGIRTESPFAAEVEPWSRVVDLRAERRGGRTVVSVYLSSGASKQLTAPYTGEFFAADPRFEMKVFALSHLWRSHRFGGVPS